MKYSEFKKSVASLTVSLMGAQKKSHELLVESVAHCFNNRIDTSWIKFLLDSFENVEGSFRIQAIIAYVEEFAGLKVSPADAGYGFTVKKNDDWKGTRGKKQLQLVKDTPWYVWAPTEKPIGWKNPEESFVSQLAKGLAAGEISETDVREIASRLVQEVKIKQQDSKVQSFAIKLLEKELAAM